MISGSATTAYGTHSPGVNELQSMFCPHTLTQHLIFHAWHKHSPDNGWRRISTLRWVWMSYMLQAIYNSWVPIGRRSWKPNQRNVLVNELRRQRDSVAWQRPFQPVTEQDEISTLSHDISFKTMIANYHQRFILRTPLKKMPWANSLIFQTEIMSPMFRFEGAVW